MRHFYLTLRRRRRREMKRTGFVSLHRMKGESGGHPRANDNARNNNIGKLSNVCCGHHLDGWPAGTPPSVVYNV
jgi:hypothetical protein